MTSIKIKFFYFKLKLSLFLRRESFSLNKKSFFFIKRSIKYLFKEIFIKKTYHFSTVNNSPVIFDCGANVGLATIYFKSIYPNSKVIAFEADAITHNILRNNLIDYSNVTTYQKALVDFEGEIKFFYNKQEAGDLGMSINERYFKDFEIVPATKLSNYIETEVDLLKLDIEGAEDLVIKDLISSKKIRYIKQMIIEYHYQDLKKPSKIGKFIRDLEENNFTCNFSTEKEEIFLSPRQQTFIIYAFNTDFILN